MAHSSRPTDSTDEKVIVDLDDGPSRTTQPPTPLDVNRVTPTRPRVELGRDATMPPVHTPSRAWIVVLAYVAAAAALGISAYVRFVA